MTVSIQDSDLDAISHCKSMIVVRESVERRVGQVAGANVNLGRPSSREAATNKIIDTYPGELS